MSNTLERRSFPRHQLNFSLKVEGKNSSGRIFRDTCQLISISGNGAQFLTRQGAHYFQDQELEIHIVLPGTAEVRGSMVTVASVCRVEAVLDAEDSPEEMKVAVRFLQSLQMRRGTPTQTEPEETR